MAKQVIQSNGRFQVLNLSSMCAYGSFETRAEAEQAIADAAKADQLSRCGQ
jgi:hypothetical protein